LAALRLAGAGIIIRQHSSRIESSLLPRCLDASLCSHRLVEMPIVSLFLADDVATARRHALRD